MRTFESAFGLWTLALGLWTLYLVLWTLSFSAYCLLLTDVALAKDELINMAASENEMRKDKELISEKKKAFYQKQKEVSDQLVDQMSSLQKKHIDEELDKWERGEWNAKDHRSSMDEVMRKIKERYQLKENDLL